MRRLALVLLLVGVGCGAAGGGGASARVLRDAFESDDGGDLDRDAAVCVAEAVIDLFDPDDVEELDGDAEELADADLDEVGLDEDDSEDVLEVLEDCGVDLEDVDADDLRGLAGDLVELALGEAYVDAVATVLDHADQLDGSDDGDRRCLARAIVVGLGTERIVDAADLDEVSDAEELADLDIDVDRRLDDVGELAGECDVDLTEAVVALLVELDLISDDPECAIEELDDDLVDRIGVAALVIGIDDPFEVATVVGADFDALIDATIGCDDFGDFEDFPNASDDEYVAAFADALASDEGAPATVDQAECVAFTWSEALGPGFFAEVLAIEPDDLAVLDELFGVGLFSEEVDSLVRAATECDVALPGLALAIVDTPQLSPEQLTCFLAVDPATAATFVAAFLGGDGDDDPAIATVFAALDGCNIPR